MTKWLWYANAAITVVAFLVLVIGLSRLAALESQTDTAAGDATASGTNARDQTADGTGFDKAIDSPLVAIARQYSDRWMPPKGSLKVTIGPTEALAAQPQWRADKGPWQNSNETVSDLDTGNHVVAFKPVKGWDIPGNLTVKILRKQTTEVAAEYTVPPPPPPQGSLKVTLGPPVAVDNQALWRTDKSPWQKNAGVIKLPLGTHNVQFKEINGWHSPQQLTVQIAEDQTTEAAAVYVKKPPPPMGALTVTSSPTEILELAQWRVDDGPWRDSNSLVDELLTGSHSVEFQALADWVAPEKITVTIDKDQITEIAAIYVRQPKGSLTVALDPPEVLDQAQWRLDAGNWQKSGTTIDSIMVGSHNLELKILPGWITPEKMTVTINQDQTTSASYAYHKQKPPPPAFSLEATLVVGENFGMAWIVLPADKKATPVIVGEKIEQYRIARINHGSITLLRDGFEYSLDVPPPKPPTDSPPSAKKIEPSKEESRSGAAPPRRTPRPLPPRPSRPERTRTPD